LSSEKDDYRLKLVPSGDFEDIVLHDRRRTYWLEAYDHWESGVYLHLHVMMKSRGIWVWGGW
jgi:hypothetical protein